MNALIGNNAESKLILLSLDDDTQEPTKSNLRRFFPDSKVNVYKARGRHRDSFGAIESIFNIIKNGAESHEVWSSKTQLITHVIKLDPETVIDDFFLLTYSESKIAILKITDQCLEKAQELTRAISRVNSDIKSITNCVERFNYVKNNINHMSLNDPKVDNPDQTAIDSLFSDYGKCAQIQMTEFVKKWLDKRICI